MGVLETATELARFPERGAGTNSERRAALWLSQELRRTKREAVVETFWCRPNWALAHAWHGLLAVAGSLVSVASPKVGGALLVLAVVSIVLDALTGVSLGRRLTLEHASQNVISPSQTPSPAVRLIITANYDAGRMGLVHRPPIRRAAARLRKLTGPPSPGWLGWMTIACVWVLVTAILRDGGATGTGIGVAQLLPTAGLVLGTFLLLDLASSNFGPAASDNASGVGLALALARALDVAPPRRLGVELVLQGASDGSMIGLSRHLRRRRAELGSGNTIVLGLGACGAGGLRWWTADGTLIPMRYAPQLVGLASRLGEGLSGAPRRGRGTSPAYPARLRGLPALSLGCLDEHGLLPRSHLPEDTPEALARAASDRLLEFALTLVEAIDAHLPSTSTGRSSASRTSA